MKRGELRDRELFGAGVRAHALRREGFADEIRLRQRAQIIDQRFALLRETQFHEIQEGHFVAELELCAFAGKTKRNQGRTDFRRGTEGTTRYAQD